MGIRLARGQRVGDRYRLERELGRTSHATTWEAVDERLDRSVSLRIFDAGLDRKSLVARAGAAASLTHPRVVRVFDTGTDDGRFFTVSEHMPTSLNSVRLPLSSENALNTAIDVAEALQYAHERGVVHGNVHEGNVLLSESGAKVADFAVAPNSKRQDRGDDLRQLGALLKRVTDEPGPNFPDGFAHVIDTLCTGGYSSSSEALSDLRSLRPAPVVGTRAAPARRGWLLLVVALLIAVTAFGATRLGKRSRETRFVPGGRIVGTSVAIANVRDFDPLGDGHERSFQVGNIVDGDPTTFWTTESYTSSPGFSGRKSGVGVLFDMGKQTEVGKAQVLFTTPGCSFEVRHSDNPTAPVGEWPTAGTPVNDSPKSAPVEFPSSTARYFLLWITRLTKGVPGTGSSYACGIAEADLFAP